jgi:hypothetical protein
MTQVMERALTLADYRSAMSDYEDAQSQRGELAAGLPALKAKRDEERERVKDAEAVVLLNGGVEGHAVTGSNTEARAAALRMALAHCEDYQVRLATLRATERAVGECEAAMDELSDTMRACRLRVEFMTAWNYREAAVEGGREFRRNRDV